MSTISTAGPFHHHLEEALYHVAEAHIREDWLIVGQVQDLSELCKCTPEMLCALAKRLVEEHASSEALDKLESYSEDEQDEVKFQIIQWNRDVLHYIVLDQAIKHGDVGLMESMFFTLLYHFVGSGSKKYATEVLELLQGLHKEWPPMIWLVLFHVIPEPVADLVFLYYSKFVWEHCLLVNFAGKQDSFLPIDQAQEHNIKDIKEIMICLEIFYVCGFRSCI